eukprot:scaffold437_cov159-Amphora_coffeaeformis.AAC.26
MATISSPTHENPDEAADKEMPDRKADEEQKEDDGSSSRESLNDEVHNGNAMEDEDGSEGADHQDGTKDNSEQEEEEDDDEREGDDDDEEEDLSEAPPPPTRRRPPPHDKRSRKRRRRDRIFQDCLSVHIPLDLTADLGVAMRRTRRKRIEALTKAYPELIPETKSTEEQPNASTAVDSNIKGDTTMDAEEEEEAGRKAKKTVAPRRVLPHVPRREDYANVVDYLEAKYVAGVMLDDEEDEDEPPEGEGASGRKDDDDDEGQGSVYSQSSFLDDRDLQRDVAEQVLAQSTTTKLELEGFDDNAFFVNVGNLEVEETFATKEGYDPVDDVDDVKKTKKKRKPAEPKEKKDTKSVATTETEKTTKKTIAKTAAAKDKGKETKLPTKKKAADKTESAESPKKKAKPGPKTPPKKKAGNTPAEKAVAAKKKLLDGAYKTVIQMVKDMSPEDLPRRKTKERVAITCPMDKKPGDSILFANPHVPGQRLKVKIPKKTAPGAVFKVSVPVAPNPEDEDDNTDHNKWSRDFYDAFGDFCYLYDEWVDLVAVVKKEAGEKDFVVYFEKRKKFDDLINEVPQDLKTPLDKTYMQKLLRRARQNRHKRERTLKRQEERAKELRTDGSEDDNDEQDDSKSLTAAGDSDKKPAAKDELKDQAEDKEDLTRTVLTPELSTEFMTIKFDPTQFKVL